MLLKIYQMNVIVFDLVYLSIMAYKEFWFSIIFFILPLRRKSLEDDISLVRKILLLNHFYRSINKLRHYFSKIIGSSKGIGREIAVKQAGIVSKTICIDIHPASSEMTTKIIQQNGYYNVYYYQCDITDRDQVESTIEQIAKDHGEITMLYHCVSVPTPLLPENVKPTVKNTIDMSVTSYFYLLDSILPRMKSNMKGHIVFLTSTAGRNKFQHRHALTVSQFAVQGLFESIVDELRISRLSSKIKTTLVHIFPMIVNETHENDIQFRTPGFFGSIRAEIAAEKVLDSVMKNKSEISIPGYCLMASRLFKIVPKNIIFLLRDYLDTGIEF